MKKFYAILYENQTWHLVDLVPINQSYLVIEAETWHDAECKLFEIVVDYNPRIYA